MRYLSLFSGIEAASVAWEPLGWECAAVAEIDPFPCAVLAHHYPHVPNLGDVSRVGPEEIAALGRIDLVVFGSPCQDLSIAGKRKGLAGERSGLFHIALDIVRWAREYCGCRWALWENVPGAFSSNKGRDFAAVVEQMAGLDDCPVPPKGWGTEGVAVGDEAMVEWAVLDAQWFGVAQRRRRVFALADFGDWADRPPVLLEPQSLRGDTAPRRGQGTGTAAAPSGGVDESGLQHIVGTLCSDTHPGAYSGQDAYTGRLVPTAYSIMPMNSGTDYKARETDIAQPVMTTPVGGNQGGDYVVQPMAFDTAQITSAANATRVSPELPASTLAKGSRMHVAYEPYTLAVDVYNGAITGQVTATIGASGSPVNSAGPQVAIPYEPYALTSDGFDASEDGTGRGGAVAFQQNVRNEVRLMGGDGAIAGALPAQPGMKQQNYLATAMRVRRLTPTECERLQGFPDGWTQVPYRGKAAADGPRYKAIGNSMAVPVMAWIGQQIDIAASGLV